MALWFVGRGLLTGAHFFGETPTTDQQHRATSDFRVAAVVGLTCVAAGAAVAWRRRGTAVRMLCGATGILSLVGVVLAFSAPTGPSTGPASPLHCQEHSGGGTDCPGG